jgi:anti-anti-sigma regulatory factor
MEKMRSKNEVFIDQQAVETMSESGLYVLAGWFRKATEEHLHWEIVPST